VVGENLGTVPPEIDAALPRHGIRGMYLAQFEAMSRRPAPPSESDVALVGNHDTPTFSGWLSEADIDERVRVGLLDEAAAPAEREGRAGAVEALARTLGCTVGEPRELLGRLLDWLGHSPSPVVIPWLEDLWLEDRQVNLPGTPSSQRPNWQRPMARLLDDVMNDPDVHALLRRLHVARTEGRAAAHGEALP
jgi:4-alpha-glucanotransferase